MPNGETSPYAAARRATSIGPDPNVPSREGLSGYFNWLLSKLVPIYPEQDVGPIDLLAAVPPLKGLKAFATGAKAADVPVEAVKGIRAYHGSPHKFERFSMEKIGTGEGAQAYGHGLYFAEKEGVAKEYKKALTDWEIHEPTGRVVTSTGSAQTFRGTPADRALAWVQDAASRSDISDPLRFAKGNAAKALRGDPDEQAIVGQLDEWIQSGAQVKPGGHMYEVNIKADPEHFLDWDKPLSEQSPHVRETLAREWLAHPEAHAHMSGSALYRSMRELPEDAAEKLRTAGIPGIRYLDQGSRATAGGELLDVTKTTEGWRAKIRVDDRSVGFQNAPTTAFTTSQPYATEAEARAWAAQKIGGGTYNYSVFDESLIDILRKYGWLPPVAGLSSLSKVNQLRERERR